MKKFFFIIGLIFLFMFSLFIPISIGNNVKIPDIKGQIFNRGNTLYVGGSGPNNYTKIQHAIDNSSDGDTVYVYDDSSPYNEYLNINKAIHLIGENINTTIIQGTGYTTIVTIQTSFVHTSNFTIYNKGSFMDVIHDGIILYHSNNISMMNIKFIGCGLSYNFWFAADNFHNDVRNNYVNGKPLVYFEDKTNEIINYSCGQIILVHCRNITVSYQNISNLRCGIILYHSNNCYLYQNHVMHSSYGILLYLSNNNTLSENILSYNSGGIKYGESSNNIFMKNIIESNVMGIDDNISPFLGRGSSEIYLLNNIFRNNGYGVFVYWTSDLFIRYNEFKNNSQGLCILTWGFLSKTYIEYNNFYSNKLSIWILEDPEYYSYNFIDGNFWGRSRVFPKLIPGVINYAGGIITVIPWIFIDWHPANDPYYIT